MAKPKKRAPKNLPGLRGRTNSNRKPLIKRRISPGRPGR